MCLRPLTVESRDRVIVLKIEMGSTSIRHVWYFPVKNQNDWSITEARPHL